MSSKRESSPFTFPYPVASLITLGFRPQNILNPELLTLKEDEIGSPCPLLLYWFPERNNEAQRYSFIGIHILPPH